MIQTQRLILREYTMDDFAALYEILSDPETMQYYPRPYDADGVRRWLNWSLQNYRQYGFGLWAIELKETGTFIGDCGITMQMIDGEQLPEIGYHINKDFWRQGYGSEAAGAVRDWAFTHTQYDRLYSYMKYTNEPSAKTAVSYGCRFIEEFADETNEITKVYAISREEWMNLQQKR